MTLPLQVDIEWYRLHVAMSWNEPYEMPKPRDEKPLVVRCPNCKQVREPDYSETTRHYACSICSTPLDAQVLIEKKKRGSK